MLLKLVEKGIHQMIPNVPSLLVHNWFSLSSGITKLEPLNNRLSKTLMRKVQLIGSAKYASIGLQHPSTSRDQRLIDICNWKKVWGANIHDYIRHSTNSIVFRAFTQT
uniref:Bet1-like SNARE 1-1 family protein n=1 Tax=Rhizophora mucronata TaxID=61149 RepID=A0A2P2LRI1_RHIMU